MTTVSTTEERFGPYRVVRRLTGGGMADIFIARKEGPGGFSKTFVVKCIRARFAEEEEFVRMFYDEARLAAKLEHPNIVHISDFGEADGGTYLAMEYLQGCDLNALLKRHGPLPVDVVAAIASQICAGLHYAHTFTDETGKPLRVVHRDISPSNLFLTKQGAVKVLDFGIARAEGRLNQTRGGMMKGKLLYMSPEQTWGSAVDARADLWALGVVLYELLTNQRPFFRGTEDEPDSVNERRTMEAIDSATPDRLGALRAEIPQEFDDLVFRCLEKKPEARWQSALELRRVLDAFLQSRGVSNSVLLDFAEKLEAVPKPMNVAPTLVADAQAVIETQLRPPELPVEATNISPSQDFVPRASRVPKFVIGLVAIAIAGGVSWLLLGEDAVPRDETRPSPRASTPEREGVVQATPREGLAPPPPRNPTGEGVVQPVPRDERPPAPPPLPAEEDLVQRPAPLPLPTGESIELHPRSVAKKPKKPIPPMVPVVPSATGTLRVTCDPWGKVSVDGTERGQANPSMTLELAAGVHRVGCAHPELGTPRGDVTITAGAVTDKRFKY